jgi:hypothetical protein
MNQMVHRFGAQANSTYLLGFAGVRMLRRPLVAHCWRKPGAAD